MTKDNEYKVAKWLMKHGSVKRGNAPTWFPAGFSGSGKYFVIEAAQRNAAGYSESSPDDLFCMTDRCKDAFAEEHTRRKQEWRADITLWVAVASLILSLISISWQTYIWTAERSKTTQPTTASDIQTADP